MKLRNQETNNLDEIEQKEIVEEKRAAKKTRKKMETSSKSDLKLKSGRLIEIMSNYKCLVMIDGEMKICLLSGRLKQLNLETRNLVAVGDYVNIDLAADETRIEEIFPRVNSLSRFADDVFQNEIVIAANLDQVVITSSLFEPELNLGLVDRYLCAAGIAEIKPIICVNKIDLATDQSILEQELAYYRRVGMDIILTSAFTGEGIEELRAVLTNRETVFSGHSGTGKTSLINKLQPGLDLKVAKVSEFSGKGMHTTTSSKLILWDFGGYLVDTPGIKTFGLHKNDKALIPRIFPGFQGYFPFCRYSDCTHTHEEKCAVKEAVENDSIPSERYESYLRIMQSLTG
ncbi:MAG: ribosome small subunit-dependent GTPase A [Candidatus Cloacimonetes bacterium]|nr:ribosome small subunit-dependent GTPase A [Candidatus Cloacimonadota bacterium]